VRRTFAVLILILLALTAIRFYLVTKVGIIPDEAYYWTWSLQPDWCYWDQPPGIAWVHLWWGKLAGDSPAALHGLALLCSFLASVFSYGLLRQVLGERMAFWSILATQLVPLFAAGSVLILHDSLLLVFVPLAWWALVVAIDQDRPHYWLLVGLVLSCALYAKLSALMLGAGFALAALAHPVGRRHLGTPWPYLGAFLAAVLFSPVLLWNIKHDAILFYAVDRLSHDPEVVGLQRLLSMLEYLAGQLGVITPVLAVLGLIGAGAAIRRRNTEDGRRRLLLAVPALFILIYFWFNSFGAAVQANWPAMAWLALIPLGLELAAIRKREGRAAFRWALHLGVLLAVTVTVLMHWQGLSRLYPLPKDITDQFYGWERLAKRVRIEQANYGPEALMTVRYQIAAELVYHLGDRPEVYTIDNAHRGSQFTLWQDYAKLVGQDVLFVDPQLMPGKLARHFSSVTELAPFVRRRSGRTVETLHFYLGRNFHTEGPLAAYFENPVRHQIARIKRRQAPPN